MKKLYNGAELRQSQVVRREFGRDISPDPHEKLDLRWLGLISPRPPPMFAWNVALVFSTSADHFKLVASRSFLAFSNSVDHFKLLASSSFLVISISFSNLNLIRSWSIKSEKRWNDFSNSRKILHKERTTSGDNRAANQAHSQRNQPCMPLGKTG